MLYRTNNYSFSMPKPYNTVNMPKTFPEDIECIVKAKDQEFGSLYISNVQAASNPVTLKRLKIGAILTMAKGYQQKHPKTLIPYYKYLQAVDHEQCKISVHFTEAVDFIDSSLKKTNLLVHCIAGVSRSVTVVIAYFIRQHNMTYDEAYRLVKSKRKIIHPNDGFIAQLRQFQKMLKLQNSRARQRSERSQGSRSIEKQISFEKYNDNLYADKDKGMIQVKSKQLTPLKSTVKDNYMQKYKSNQIDKYSYVAKHHPSIPVSLQYIPNHSYQKIEADKAKILTPKNVDYKKNMYSYQLPRSNTNYYTPAKQVPREAYNTSTITYTKYRESPISTKLQTKMQRPITTSPIPKQLYTQQKTLATHSSAKQYNPQQRTFTASPITKQYNPRQSRSKSPIDNPNQHSRQQFFDTMNTQLNDKIQKIRQKYQIQRQKLYSKYQTISTNDNQHKAPQENKKSYDTPYQSKHTNQNKYVTHKHDNYTDRIQSKYEKTYRDYARQYPKQSKVSYQNIYNKRTQEKNHSLPKKAYEPYQPRYSKNHLNEQESYYKKFERTATSNSFSKTNNYPTAKLSHDYPSSKINDLQMNRYNGYINTKTYGLSFYDKSYQFTNKRLF